MEAVQTTTGPSGLGGELNFQEGGQYHPNSARWLEFDVFEPMRLLDVTLFASGTYDRSFEVINAFGQVLWSSTVTVTDGEFILPIGLELSPARSMACGALRTIRSCGVKDLIGVELPVRFGRMGSITNSTAGPSLDYYCFFYKWNVQSTLEVECSSPRAAVTVTVSRCTDPEACNYNPTATVDDGRANTSRVQAPAPET